MGAGGGVGAGVRVVVWAVLRRVALETAEEVGGWDWARARAGVETTAVDAE